MLLDAKLCPWCGEIPAETVSEDASATRAYVSVICGCGARGPTVKVSLDDDYAEIVQEAVSAWNKRKEV